MLDFISLYLVSFFLNTKDEHNYIILCSFIYCCFLFFACAIILAAVAEIQMIRNNGFKQMSSKDFEALGLSMVLRWTTNHRNEKARLRRFKAFFGTGPDQAAMLWHYLNKHSLLQNLKRPEPKHLLWALLFLKDYGTEEKLSALVGGVDEKTFRKWTWTYIKALAGLSQHFVCIYFFV